MKIHGMKVEEGAAPETAPGTVLEAGGEGPLVAAGSGLVRLVQVQPAGKKAMAGAAFLCGHRLRAGERMEEPAPGKETT